MYLHFLSLTCSKKSQHAKKEKEKEKVCQSQWQIQFLANISYGISPLSVPCEEKEMNKLVEDSKNLEL